ncbi:transposase [Streptomyces sp. NPDC020794]|uniref:transposase n=1 Tax=unclassified Streptomyces TaxID=2593676 RepID=UPI0036EA62DC
MPRHQLDHGPLASATGGATTASANCTNVFAVARTRRGRNAEPSAGTIDSQPVDDSETVGEDSRGYDGGKRRDGRNRHVLTDSEGPLLAATVTPADVHDSKAAPELMEKFMAEPGRMLRLVWVDSAYQGQAPAEAFARDGVRVEVVRRPMGSAASPSWPAAGWSSAH